MEKRILITVIFLVLAAFFVSKIYGIYSPTGNLVNVRAGPGTGESQDAGICEGGDDKDKCKPPVDWKKGMCFNAYQDDDHTTAIGTVYVCVEMRTWCHWVAQGSTEKECVCDLEAGEDEELVDTCQENFEGGGTCSEGKCELLKESNSPSGSKEPKESKDCELKPKESDNGVCQVFPPLPGETDVAFDGTRPDGSAYKGDSGWSDDCEVVVNMEGPWTEDKPGKEWLNDDNDPDRCFHGEIGLGTSELVTWGGSLDNFNGEFKGSRWLSDNDDVTFGDNIGEAADQDSAECQALKDKLNCE